MSSDEDDGELGGSELGTQSYWDDAYTLEIKNFKRSGDIGEIWFGEDSLLRAVRWITDCQLVSQNDSIVDIGCGNGMTLLELAREGFTDLTGLDYSIPGIQLASAVCKEEFPDIKFKVCDIINDEMVEYSEKFKIVHDKGTYDAVSIDPADSKSKRRIYMNKVNQILLNDGYFVITSCNWTENELKEHFKEKFSVKKVIPSPTFKFGGVVGNVCTLMVFEKNKDK